jgi:serine/threonine-protein kinase
MTDDSDLKAALPDYVVERELGQGGMGVVFLGRHARLGRMVAIKELPPAFSSDPDVRERFSTEARTLAALSHPHIVPIYDYVERDGLCLIVMEELPGGTVWDRFTSTGLTPPTACAVALACCAALQHAHTKGVLHLDVKPDNLMFATDAAIKVTDFGISRVLSGDRTLGTLDGQVLGTPAYMSPEQARGADLSPASDVYSAGVMLYELLSGHLPWGGAETATELLLKRLREDPRPLREVAPHVPPGLADVVMKAIEREPENRYQEAEAFGLAIASACADAWGPSWLDHAGVSIIGSERLSMAARTTRSQPVVDPGADGWPGTASAARATGEAPRTVIEGAAAAESRVAAETTAAGAAAAGASTAGAAAEVPAPPTAPPAIPEFQVVRAAGAAPRLDGANLNRLDRAALVDVSDIVGHQPRARWAFAGAAALAVAAVIAAALLFSPPSRTGNLRAGDVRIDGVDVAHGTPSWDLSHNLPIVVQRRGRFALANKATFEMSVLGLPLQKVSTNLVGGRGTFDTKVASHVVTGSVGVKVDISGGSTVLGHEELPAKLTQPWYLTASGIGSLLVLLAGLAYLEGAIRPLRRARRSVGALIGCAVSAAIVAAGAIGLIASLGHADPTVGGLIVACVASAAAGVFLGIGIRRRAVYRGAHRALRRARAALPAAAR